MSIIGKQIKKFRTEKGITQEQLGEQLCVTTQAVSRWERGGTPDAELLPELARILDVSIDALFGREEQSIAQTIARGLCRLSNEEAYHYAFMICWALEMGLLQDLSALDGFLGGFIDNIEITKSKVDVFCKIMQDGGMATVRLSPELHQFFLLTEPPSGLRSQLADPETLRSVFEIFADKKMLKIIFYMYTRLNTPIATSLISKSTGLSLDDVDRCMAVLCANHLATCSVIATADGDIHTYMFHQESSVIPLLCFADEICKKDFRDFVGDFSRTKPLLG